MISHKTFVSGIEKSNKQTLFIKDHEAGLLAISKLLTEGDLAVIEDPSEIEIVGHRVVHGGESFRSTTLITPEVMEKIKELFALAPLHNPPNYLGIEVAMKIFTAAKQLAVFDTAFYKDMPPQAYRYAIPNALYTEQKIRAYGFHGTSHQYVSAVVRAKLNNPRAKIISIHLGNGCSITAINGETAIDTSMGFGPLSGLVMGTRAGDIDASVIFHLVNEMGLTAERVSEMLNKESGLLGLTGYNDMRDVLKQMSAGNEDAILAIKLYTYRIKKYIGAYAAALNGLDAMIFTGGVGENAVHVRAMVCHNMEYLGIIVDEKFNDSPGSADNLISSASSAVKVFVIPTNEELEIAEQCMRYKTIKTFNFLMP